MQFNTALLGTVEVDESQVITFPAGLPAFENCTRFKLFHEVDKNPRVFWLQSLDQPDVLFSVVDPAQFGLRYEFQLNDAEVDALQLARPEDAAVVLIVYKEDQANDNPPALSPLKVNTRNPLVINVATQRALQKTGLVCDITFRD